MSWLFCFLRYIVSCRGRNKGQTSETSGQICLSSGDISWSNLWNVRLWISDRNKGSQFAKCEPFWGASEPFFPYPFKTANQSFHNFHFKNKLSMTNTTQSEQNTRVCNDGKAIRSVSTIFHCLCAKFVYLGAVIV